MIILSLWFCSSLAKFKQELLEDEYGPCGAEDDEGLTAEEAEDGAGQGRPQEALHHPLQEETGRRTVGGAGDAGIILHSRHTRGVQRYRNCSFFFLNFSCFNDVETIKDAFTHTSSAFQVHSTCLCA